MTATLRIEDLTIRVPERALVSNFTAEIRPGAPLTLLGESGSGKSLVAQAVMGTLPPGLTATGRIRLGGADLLRLDGRARERLWGRRISLLPQEPWSALDPTMRALPQLAEVHRYVHRRPEAERWAAEGLGEIGLGEAGRLYPFQMSGGMCQRLAFAVSRAAGSQVLLADEPSKGLDEPLRDEVTARLRQEVRSGCLLLTITHDLALARALGGTASVMLDGRTVESGLAGPLLDAPAEAYTRALVEADPGNWPRRPPRTPGPVVVEGMGIAKGFGPRRLFADLDLEIRAGEIVAVTGPSGSGKTTLGNILVGTTRPDRGQVRRAPGVPQHRFQKLYQDPPAAFVPHQSMGQALDHLVRRHGLSGERVETLLVRLKLGPGLRRRRPAELSGGELQRFALARVLLLDPVFLFADEATSRLDPVMQWDVIEILCRMVDEEGLSLLLSTHDRDLIEKVTDRTISLTAGCGGCGPDS